MDNDAKCTTIIKLKYTTLFLFYFIKTSICWHIGQVFTVPISEKFLRRHFSRFNLNNLVSLESDLIQISECPLWFSQPKFSKCLIGICKNIPQLEKILEEWCYRTLLVVCTLVTDGMPSSVPPWRFPRLGEYFWKLVFISGNIDRSKFLHLSR